MAKLKWLGHSSFELELGGKIIFFDPWFNTTPQEVARTQSPSITAKDVRAADLIFITHEHFDHCDNYDVATMLEKTAAHVVAPSPALSKLSIAPRAKVEAVPGDAFSYRGVDVDVYSAQHPQSSQAVSYQVSVGGKSVFFAGDSYDHYGFSNVQADVAVIPIGGSYTMDVLGSVSAIKKMRVKYVVPMHYNTFSRINANAQDWAERVKKETKAIPIVLKIGESFEF